MGLLAHAQRRLDIWSVLPAVIAGVLILPLLFVLFSAFQPAEWWEHLVGTVLTGYVLNTGILLLCVGVLSILLALPPAWLIASTDFPARALFQWLHLLPLAVPTYIAAFTAYEIPQAAIPLLLHIRESFGIAAYQSAESTLRYSVLVFFLASVLYPYLYLALQTAFSSQSQAILEASQSLGRSATARFFTISLPLVRPAMVGGLALISMEVINEYGAIHFFGVPTLTEGIFRTWFGLDDPISAMRIAVLAMALVFFILSAELWSRRESRYAGEQTADRVRRRSALRGWHRWAAWGICLLPLIGGLLYPIGTLLRWNVQSQSGVPARVWDALFQSTALAGGTAVFILILGVILAYAGRVHRGASFQTFNQLPTYGYAVPGAVIGAGVMMLGQTLQSNLGFILTGTLLAIVLGYSLRFLAVAYHPLNGSMTRLCGTLDEASRALGQGPSATLFRIHLPLLRPVLCGIGILAFIDILKELPLTLILRPAGFETLSTRIFGLASEGRIEDVAAPSLLLIAVAATGLIIGYSIFHRAERGGRSGNLQKSPVTGSKP